MRRLAAIAIVALCAAGVSAQTLPADPAAEGAFGAALEAFRDGRYESAAEGFLAVADDYEVHLLTTAASVMAGKALYRAGFYRQAAEHLVSFERAWPRSSYLEDARRTRRLAEEAARRVAQGPLELGVLLSLRPEEAALSQALFNGLLLAVEGHNAARPDLPVRLVFGEIGTFAESAGSAMAGLAREGVHAVIGGLFSDQALAAAAAAQRFGIVYVAPLATDDAVSRDRSFVFQTNPTLETRGRRMARFAMNGLLMDSVAVLAAQGDGGVNEITARAFADEFAAMGGSVPFQRLLPSAREWYRLPQYLSADSLGEATGIYIPISGSGSDRIAAAALAGLDEVGANVRVLGNARWHDLPILSLASRYTTTYSNDYLIDDTRPDVQLFFGAYETRFGNEPSRVSVVGYDTGRLLLSVLDAADAESMAERLRAAPMFDGLGMQIDFEGGQVNQALFYHRYRGGRVERIR